MGNGTFILQYSKVSKPPPPPPPPPATPHTPPYPTPQATTTWSLELGNIKGFWKKLIESEQTCQNVRKTIAIPKNGSSYSIILKGVKRWYPRWGTLITIKNHQIDLHNEKQVKNMKIIWKNMKSYAARA